MNASQNGPLGNGSPRRERRHFTAEQKVAIVKRHLVDGVPVSDLCDEHQLLPNQFYQWHACQLRFSGLCAEGPGATMPSLPVWPVWAT